jgi:hypothetical protein
VPAFKEEISVDENPEKLYKTETVAASKKPIRTGRAKWS